MALHRTSYDSLHLTVAHLQVLLTEQEKTMADFKKAEESHQPQLGKHLVEVLTAKEQLIKSLNSQFQDLRSDFQSGALNLVKYRERLSFIKSLLTDREEPVKSSTLDISGMAKEIHWSGC